MRADLTLLRKAGIVLVAATLWGAGCTPSCERTCRKLLKCGNLETDRVSVRECEANCEVQLGLYEGWDDEKELDKALDQHRRCLVRSTCEEIEAGECYDDRLYPVGLPTSELDTGLQTSQ